MAGANWSPRAGAGEPQPIRPARGADHFRDLQGRTPIRWSELDELRCELLIYVSSWAFFCWTLRAARGAALSQVSESGAEGRHMATSCPRHTQRPGGPVVRIEQETTTKATVILLKHLICKSQQQKAVKPHWIRFPFSYRRLFLLSWPIFSCLGIGRDWTASPLFSAFILAT